MTLEFLTPLLGPGMAEVDVALKRALDSRIALIRQIADYIIGSGGKRLRPALLLLAAGACGHAGREQYTLAAVVEMIHTATLLHDDVVDESAQRRGRATANAAFGNAAAVLVGDFLYSRAFQMMVEVDRMAVLRIIGATPVDDMDQVWVNGTLIGQTGAMPTTRKRIPGRRRRRRGSTSWANHSTASSLGW